MKVAPPFLFALVMIVATTASAEEGFYRKHLPAGVKMGISPAELQEMRPSALKNELRRPVGGANGSLEMVEMVRHERDAPVVYSYRFREGKLSAVTKAMRTTQLPAEHTRSAVSSLTDELKADSTLKGQDEMIRSVGYETAIITAQLWEDKTGLNTYFVATNQEIDIIMFGPKVFGKIDFFLGPEKLESVKAGNESLRRQRGNAVPTHAPIIDLLARSGAGSPVALVERPIEMPRPHEYLNGDKTTKRSSLWVLWGGSAAALGAAAGWLWLRSKRMR